MKEQSFSINGRILYQVLYPPTVKGTWTADNTMYLIVFFKEQLCKVGTVLSGYTCDERAFKSKKVYLVDLKSSYSNQLKVHLQVFLQDQDILILPLFVLIVGLKGGPSRCIKGICVHGGSSAR